MRRPGFLRRPLHTVLPAAVLTLAIGTLFALVWLLVPSDVRLMALVITTFLALAVICVLVLPARLVSRDVSVGKLTPDQHASAVNSARTALLQGLVGLAALAGIFVAWQQLQNDREQLREQLALTRQGQVAERFTRAVGQLGDDRLEVRIGGIYGLEEIVGQAPDIRLTVYEVLVAYLRRRAPKKENVLLPASNRDLHDEKPEVHAALRVLGRRHRIEENDPRLDLGQLDLRRANLRGANLCFADLRDTSLRRANLRDANLRGALLNRADLRDADLPDVDLTGANLAGADLAGAVLTGAKLTGANLAGASSDQKTIWPDGFDWQGASVNSEPITLSPSDACA